MTYTPLPEDAPWPEDPAVRYQELLACMHDHVVDTLACGERALAIKFQKHRAWMFDRMRESVEWKEEDE